MQFKQLVTDEDAVSPVIGVILMVAITVILAAVIASFVLGLGGTEDPAPVPTMDWSTEESFDYTTYGGLLDNPQDESDVVVIDITGGDSFDSSDVLISVGGSGVNATTEHDGTPIEDEEPWYIFDEDVDSDEDVSAGNTAVVPVEDLDDWEIDLIYDPADGDREIITGEDS